MPKTQVNCPNCRQPLVADVEQVFDQNTDPAAKQRLLSGAFNLIQCQFCGYQGNLSTPIVYHDPDKELLLTFVPTEIGMARDDQERLLGGLINQVVNNLDQEKRKGYLLNPKATLTMQGLIERVLEADGITKEMLDAQQKRIRLIERLAQASDESVLEEIARQEDALIDGEFFALMNRLIEISMGSGDQQSAQQLANLQRSLLPITTFGRQVQEQSREVETAMNDLREAGENLTREKLLEFVESAPNETRLQALVSLARPVMDYTFFQLLSERIDRARGEGRERLVKLRTDLLELTQEIDRQVQERVEGTRRLIETILETGQVAEAMQQSMPYVDEIFINEVNDMLAESRQQGNFERSGQLQQMLDIIQEASSGPPELALIEEFVDLSTEEDRQQFLQSHEDEITQEFMDLLANLTVQIQAGEDKDMAERFSAANRQALRFSMQRSFQSE